jgi:hypothetical protein
LPDWTYHPLRRPMGALLGVPRSRRAALGLVGAVATFPGGTWLVAGLGHTSPPPEASTTSGGIRFASPVGATVGIDSARNAARAFPALGAGLLEIGPISSGRLDQARRILRSSPGPVALRVAADDAPGVIRALEIEMRPGARLSRVGLIVIDITEGPVGLEMLNRIQASTSVPVFAACDAGQILALPDQIGVVIRNATPADVKQAGATSRSVIATTSKGSPGYTANLIGAGAAMVLATPAALIEAGPGWFHRATIARLARAPIETQIAPASRWPWVAGLALGLGMIAGGIGATAVAMGPVLLPYDESFLGVTSGGLAAINPRLIHFLQHDRITLAGTMVAIGILYSALSWWGIRRGQAWARDALLASCLIGFPTLFYFFAFRYVEPIHVALAAILFPLFVIATWRRPRASYAIEEEGPADERQRALIGQLLMVSAGAGLIVGGLTISYIGLTSVFVPTDLTYMSTSAQALASVNARLISFIAHDRAGFGGALISTGVAVLLFAAWGWKRGQAWVWWSLAASAAVGFGAALAIHIGVAYTDFWHVAPIYAGSLITVIALGLAREYFLTAPSRVQVPPAATGELNAPRPS